MPVLPLREGLTVRLEAAADGQSRRRGGPGAATGSRCTEQGIGRAESETLESRDVRVEAGQCLPGRPGPSTKAALPPVSYTHLRAHET